MPINHRDASPGQVILCGNLIQPGHVVAVASMGGLFAVLYR